MGLINHSVFVSNSMAWPLKRQSRLDEWFCAIWYHDSQFLFLLCYCCSCYDDYCYCYYCEYKAMVSSTNAIFLLFRNITASFCINCIIIPWGNSNLIFGMLYIAGHQRGGQRQWSGLVDLCLRSAALPCQEPIPAARAVLGYDPSGQPRGPGMYIHRRCNVYCCPTTWHPPYYHFLDLRITITLFKLLSYNHTMLLPLPSCLLVLPPQGTMPDVLETSPPSHGIHYDDCERRDGQCVVCTVLHCMYITIDIYVYHYHQHYWCA
jgi:hypothetical protein